MLAARRHPRAWFPWLRAAALAATLATGAERAAAQVGTVSATHVISLAAAKPGALTVSVTSGGTQTISSLTDNALNTFPSPATIVTQWDLHPGQSHSVTLVAYFSLPNRALVGPSAQLPASRVRARMPTGIPTTFTPINGNGVGGVGTAGGSLRLFTENINGRNKQSSRTDNLFLQLDLTGIPALPPGTYTGTLNLRAIVQ